MENINEKILQKLLAKKRGTFVRVSIKSKVPGTAKAVHNNVNLCKFTTTTLRIGVNYANIKGVFPKGTSPSWYRWEVPNLVAVHNETGAKYINFGTTPHSNTKTVWFADGEETSPEKLVKLGYLTPVMLAKKHTPVVRVALNNIYRVS